MIQRASSAATDAIIAATACHCWHRWHDGASVENRAIEFAPACSRQRFSISIADDGTSQWAPGRSRPYPKAACKSPLEAGCCGERHWREPGKFYSKQGRWGRRTRRSRPKSATARSGRGGKVYLDIRRHHARVDHYSYAWWSSGHSTTARPKRVLRAEY